MPSKFDSLFVRLGAFQTKYPMVVLALALISLIPAGWATSQLTLRTAFSELLPDSQPSVIEQRRLESRLSSTSTYNLVISGADVPTLKRFIDALSPRLRSLPKELVASVDDGTRQSRAFIEKNKHLYADLAEIQTIHDQIVERYDYEVGKASGLGLDLEEDEVPKPFDAQALESRLEKKAAEARKAEPGVDGYFIGGKDRTIGAILINTPCGEGSAGAAELRKRVAAEVAALQPSSFAPKLQVDYTGSLVTSGESKKEITTDLAEVGVFGVCMILAVVFIFFLRIRTLFCILITIAIGCVWAFGLARYSVGYLNTATGFLTSIIAGNGINFGIMYLARYVEARRDEHRSVADSIALAHRDTYSGTFAASLAAMVSYGSLIATDFRGFRHFGLISGGGMVLCWLATYLVLPSILVISERIRPMYQDKGSSMRVAGLYGYPFAWLAHRFPRAMATTGILFGLAGLVLGVRYFRDDPIEYNYRMMRASGTHPSSASRLSREIDDLVGRIKQDGKAIVTDRFDQVQPLVAELEHRRGLAKPGEEPFGKIVSVYDFLPRDQDKKLPLLTEIRDRLERARNKGLIKDADWARLSQHIPETLKAVTIEDLPEPLARPFTERDGARGRIVYLAPREGISVYDMKYVMSWADSFREVKLPNGEVIRGSGSPVIFADMILSIQKDGPKAMLLSLIGTFAIVLLAFRGRRSGFVALGTLALGLAWLAVFVVVLDVHLNFLNFVALPISIGVGADYAINMMKRHDIEGHAALHRIVVETGGAVILCSMTTMAGDFGLLFSINGAVRSYGLLAALGELSTLIAGLVVLPAALHWAHLRRNARPASVVEASQR
ncbi:MAG: efflux RND transporter permease subunit [Myxococcales bacterium]